MATKTMVLSEDVWEAPAMLADGLARLWPCPREGCRGSLVGWGGFEVRCSACARSEAVLSVGATVRHNIGPGIHALKPHEKRALEGARW